MSDLVDIDWAKLGRVPPSHAGEMVGSLTGQSLVYREYDINWTNASVSNMPLFNGWLDSKGSVLPIYKKLIASGLKIWVYSGDTNGRVPVLSTGYSLSSLGLPIKRAWRAWYHQQQVGGWFQEYDGLIFATFRGAGHDVPIFKPSASLAFFASFLSGELLPAQR